MSNPTTNQDGNKCWFNDKGQLHRVDGPAIEYANGTKQWYLNGLRHRVDGPAIELANGTKHWFQKGQYHRVDGPAIEKASGEKQWWQNGQCHRIDGPAIEWVDGNKAWFQYDIKVNPNIKIKHNICNKCKNKCHNEPKLINIPIDCNYELEHIIYEGNTIFL